MFTVIGGKFKFQVQDSDMEYFFLLIWRFEKYIALSEKKKPLGVDFSSIISSNFFLFRLLNMSSKIGYHLGNKAFQS